MSMRADISGECVTEACEAEWNWREIQLTDWSIARAQGKLVFVVSTEPSLVKITSLFTTGKYFSRLRINSRFWSRKNVEKKFVWQTRFFFVTSIQFVACALPENLSDRSSGVQIPRYICTRFGRYLYSTKCSWIISTLIRFILNNTDYFLYLLMRNSLHVASDVLKHSFVFFKFNAPLIIWRFRPMMLDPKKIMTFTDSMQMFVFFLTEKTRTRSILRFNRSTHSVKKYN